MLERAGDCVSSKFLGDAAVGIEILLQKPLGWAGKGDCWGSYSSLFEHCVYFNLKIRVKIQKFQQLDSNLNQNLRIQI